MSVDPVSLQVFKSKFESVAEEMGVALQRTAYSPNIKERRDFSCAVFDPQATSQEESAFAQHISYRTQNGMQPRIKRFSDLVLMKTGMGTISFFM